MPLLVDRELVALYEDNCIITDKKPPENWYDMNSPVQPSSIDLHIGKIFVPEVKPDRRGGINKPKTDSHTLPPGGTAFVETDEELNVPSNFAGFGFPPASIAVKGILMTNPGHIDPGFRGHLTFTLINMGKDSFTIRNGDILFTTLWMKLNSDVERDYYTRTNGKTTGVKEENIDVLSKDFLNVENRAKSIAKKYLTSAAVIASIVSILGLGVQYAINHFGEIDNRMNGLEKSMAVLQVKLEERDSKQNIKMRESINSLMSRIEAVEKKIQHHQR